MPEPEQDGSRDICKRMRETTPNNRTASEKARTKTHIKDWDDNSYDKRPHNEGVFAFAQLVGRSKGGERNLTARTLQKGSALESTWRKSWQRH